MRVHVWLAVAHLADLVVTSSATYSMEANPLLRIVWCHWGFGAVVGVKVLCWTGTLLYHLAVLYWAPNLAKYAVWGLWIGTAFLAGVCVWNMWQLRGGVL